MLKCTVPRALLWICTAITAMLVVPVLVLAIDGQPHRSLSPTVDPPRSTPIETGMSRSPEQVVEIRQLELRQTTSEISQLYSEIAGAKERLEKAKLAQNSISEESRTLASTIQRLDADAVIARTAVEAAKQRLADFRATIPDRLTRAERSAAAARENESREAASRIAAERRSRNELRARIGAIREDQSEAQNAVFERNKAQRQSEARYLSATNAARAELASEVVVLSRHVASAEAECRRLLIERSRAAEQLATATSSLEETLGVLASIPTAIESMELELASLNKLRVSREQLLEIAVREQQRHQEQLTRATLRIVPEATIASASSASTTGFHSSVLGSIPSGSGPNFFNFPVYSGRYFDPTYRPAVGEHYVSGHFRRDGAYVQGHFKTNSDDSFWNNWSSRGNINPHTGKTGSKTPSFMAVGSGGYVHGYVRGNGTYVVPHYRRK